MNDHSTNVFQDMINSIGAFVQVKDYHLAFFLQQMNSRVEILAELNDDKLAVR